MLKAEQFCGNINVYYESRYLSSVGSHRTPLRLHILSHLVSHIPCDMSRDHTWSSPYIMKITKLTSSNPG